MCGGQRVIEQRILGWVLNYGSVASELDDMRNNTPGYKGWCSAFGFSDHVIILLGYEPRCCLQKGEAVSVPRDVAASCCDCNMEKGVVYRVIILCDSSSTEKYYWVGG